VTLKSKVEDAAAPPRLRAGEPAAAGSAGTLADDTLAELAHELRTPLAAIHSLADVIAAERFGSLDNDIYRDYAGRIRDAARHLLDAVESMLAVSPEDPIARQQIGDLTVDLNEVARTAHAMLAALAERRSAKLELRLAPSLPLALADRTAVTRIAINLGRNALRHTPLGATVALRTGTAADGAIWLEIEDDGPGLPPAVAAAYPGRDAASEADAAAASAEGTPTGRGLPMVRRLAAANGASLSFPKSSATGTRARLTFARGRLLTQG